MQVLLAYKSNAAGAQDPYTSLLPIGIGYMNAFLNSRGYSSAVANFSRSTWKAIESHLHRLKPDVFGISQFTHNRFESLKLASLAKKVNPSTIVVFGGPHATHQFNEILENYTDVDAVVLGEGEESFLDILQVISGQAAGFSAEVKGIAFRSQNGIISTQPRAPISDLDSIPFPAAYMKDAHGVDLQRQLEFIITSRGCPASCLFCSSPQFWGKSLRFRSPRNVVDEIAFIRDRYGLLYFSIRDDTFTADKKRVMEFCRLLRQENLFILWNCQSRVNAVDEEMLLAMKCAGCECIQFGVESGSPRLLHALGKGIKPEQMAKATAGARKAGLNISIYLITGVDGETEEDINASVKLIETIMPHDGQVSPLAYFPGTELFNRGVRSGTIDRDAFIKNQEDALYIRTDSFVSSSTRTLLRTLKKVGKSARYNEGDFLAQKKLLGYCYTTNMMAGEFYEAKGKWQQAELEYREIIKKEPTNPWGWLLLGELYGSIEEPEKGCEAYGRVLKLVPTHAPAYSAMGQLMMARGKTRDAKSYFERALTLDPFDALAREAMSGR